MHLHDVVKSVLVRVKHDGLELRAGGDRRLHAAAALVLGRGLDGEVAKSWRRLARLGLRLQRLPDCLGGG